MLAEVLPHNPFYRAKLGAVSFVPARDPISVLPFTTRAEVEAIRKGREVVYSQAREEVLESIFKDPPA